MNTMKTVVCTQYGSPEVLRLTETAVPVPSAHEVRIRIFATSVTVADTRIRGFRVPAAMWIPARLFLGLPKPVKPVLGVELSGVIDSVGSKVRRFKPGEAVIAGTMRRFGAYAEYICLPEDGLIIKKPEELLHEQAAVLPTGALTALHYLRKGNIKPGQEVLIYGASGSVGTYAIQLAKLFGASVTAVCSTKNHELVKSLGACKVADYNQKDFTKKLGKYDMIFVAIDKFPWSACKRHLKESGVFINITNPVKSPALLWESVKGKRTILAGENIQQVPEDLEFIAEMAAKGKLKPVLDKTYTLDRIAEAHQYVDKGHKRGNVAVTIYH